MKKYLLVDNYNKGKAHHIKFNEDGNIFYNQLIKLNCIEDIAPDKNSYYYKSVKRARREHIEAYINNPGESSGVFKALGYDWANVYNDREIL